MAEQAALKTYSRESTREDLNAYAAELGIEAPEKLANKTELIASIVAIAGDPDGVFAPKPAPSTDRMETFEAVRPNGDRVRVTRNIDTGAQTVTPVTDSLERLLTVDSADDSK